MNNLTIIDEGIVWKNQHPSIRSLIAMKGTNLCLGNGEILHAARLGQARQSADARCMLLRSTDYGKTWQQVLECLPGKNIDPHFAYSQAWLSHGKDDKIWASSSKQTIVGPEDDCWTVQNSGWINSDNFICHSLDKGLTWSEPVYVNPESPKGGFHCVSSPVYELDNGEMMLVFEPFYRSTLDTMSHKVTTFYSKDQGKNWGQKTIIAHDKNSLVYFDPRMAKLPDGRWLCMFWTHDKKSDESLNTSISYSNDGHQWSTPARTALWGFLTLPLLLNDGRLLAVYNHRRQPQGIHCAVSEDAGQSWDLENEYVLWDARARKITGELAAESRKQSWNKSAMEDMWGWDFGVPSPILLDDGTILVTFYATQMDHIMHERYVRFSIKN